MLLLTASISYAQKDSKMTIDTFTKTLEESLTKRMKEKNVPGAAIAIIDKGKVVYKEGIGWADREKQITVTEKTGFNIGSISKMFTAWGILKLVEKGKVDLDAPIEIYIRRWKLPETEFDKKKITVRSLLSHTGGISVHGYPGFHPDQTLPTLEASLDGVNGDVRANEPVEVIIAPQTKFKYSGGGYTLLQLLIEEVTETSFATYMQQEIFDPLKMKNSSFHIDGKILKNSAKPYDEEGKEVYLERFTAQAAAGLHTTLEDLLLFAHASLQENSIVSRKSMEEMRTPVPLSNGNYGLGYIIYPFGAITVKGHAGSNTGWESAFFLDFEHQSGMVMLSNGSQGDNVLKGTLRQWVQWKTAQLKGE